MPKPRSPAKSRRPGSEFTLTLGLETGQADDGRLLAAVASSRGYVEEAGRVLLLPPQTLERLTKAQRALAGDPDAGTVARSRYRIAGPRIAEVHELIEELAPHRQAPETWLARSGALRNLAGLAPAPLPDALAARLRPYQPRLESAWRLWHLWRNQLGGILADEMGLGKTPQALALLAAGRAPDGADGQPPAPALVVCPASLVENWRREAANFTPEARVFVHHGTLRLGHPREADGHDLIITSYGTLTRDREFFAKVEFGCLIADEAQHVKNRRTQNARALRALQARSRFLLTGTPVENSLDDLRALFDLLMPGYLDPVPAGTRGDQRGWFDERLRAKTAPVHPAPHQARGRARTPGQDRTNDLGANRSRPKPRSTARCSRIPNASCSIWRQAAPRKTPCGWRPSPNCCGCGRFAAIRGWLMRIRARKIPPNWRRFASCWPKRSTTAFRLLVFSQFTSLLALLRAELEASRKSRVLSRRIDVRAPPAGGGGPVPRLRRRCTGVHNLVEKAGSTGLNLTAADTVVHFDPWWNPAVEAQATDRAHRIGQQRAVTSYKLIVAGTVEEKVLQMQEAKPANPAGGRLRSQRRRDGETEPGGSPKKIAEGVSGDRQMSSRPHDRR